MPPIFPYMIPAPAPGAPMLPPPVTVSPPGGPAPYDPQTALSQLAAMRAGGQAAASPYLSPAQALLGGALNGYGAGQASQAQAFQARQSAAAAASQQINLAQIGNQGKENVADVRAGAQDRATASRSFTTMYGINTRASGLSDADYNKALTHMTDGIGSGALDPELAGRMMSNLRGGGTPGAGAAPAGAGGGLPGAPPALADPLQSAPLTDSSGKPLPGQKAAGDAPPGGRGFGLDALRLPAPPPGQSAAPLLPAGALPPAATPAPNPPLPAPGTSGIEAALRASNPANLPALQPPAPGAPAMMTPGTPPAVMPAAPPALPVQAGQPPPAAVFFSGLGPGPMTAAKLAELATQTQLKAVQGKRLGNQDEINFQTAIGLLPKPQQPGFAAEWNARNGTNYALPGAARPLPAGVQGPPGQTPAYTPNLLQGADIRLKDARAGLDTTVAGLAGKKFDLSVLTQTQRNAYQGRLLSLKARGLDDSAAARQAQLELGQGRLGLDRTKYLHPNAPDKDTSLLQAKFEQRLTQLMAPGKPDYMGNAGEPLVKLDKAGQPSGAGANEYLQLMHLMKNATGGGAGPAGQTGAAPNSYTGPIPKGRADFHNMTPQQKYDYKNVYLRGLNHR